jgi:predicted alpha/beta hydrolase family esterase
MHDGIGRFGTRCRSEWQGVFCDLVRAGHLNDDSTPSRTLASTDGSTRLFRLK